MQLLYNIERLTLNNLFAEYKIEKKRDSQKYWLANIRLFIHSFNKENFHVNDHILQYLNIT